MSLAQSAPSTSRYRRVSLGDILTLINGRAYKQEELLAAGTPVIRIQNLNGGDRWYYSDLKLPEDKYCSEGDLLFAWSATFGPYFWNGPKAIFHYHIWKIVPSGDLDKRFAFYLLQNITSRVKSAGRGISMIHMTKSGMEAWEVDLPPLDEQKRIAAILDKADQLRQKRRQAIALLDSLTQSIFLEMFGDPISNPKDWAMARLEDVASFRSGGTPSKSSPSFWVGQIPWVSPKDMKSITIEGSIDHISESAIKHSPIKLAPVEAVLIVVRGMILAHSVPIGILAREATFNQDIKAIVFNSQIDPNFGLWNLLSQREAILQHTSTAAHGTKRLEMDVVAKLPVLCPPAALQEQFRNRCHAASRSLKQHRDAKIEGDRLFRSLQSIFFSTGQPK